MIPFARIQTLSLDVGNTLISVDFDHVAAGLEAHGLTVAADVLRRAEAAARPALSKHFSVPAQPGGPEPFVIYLQSVLAHLPDSANVLDDLAAFVGRAAPAIRGARSSALWRSVMPGVREALADFRDLGLRLVVVSNSDGTVEQALVDAGLRPFFEAVLDSAVVGAEKPDPRIFRRALDLVGADADTTLHVGDLYDADVIGARAAGLHAVLLDPYDDWTHVDCERIADLPALAHALRQAR